ncbi:hypothetical protein SAMN04488038_104199 [Solimonas aquatica]|uniref:Uncharacterized protein n=1 Tax=Solimonas aquatica TaxID=489703 RepID=A0A1H9DXM2_9GAMM|nr:MULTISPECIES: hypothetical protein [Solimonas]SEQ18082.1 hypothetical protein SAMN04488038_104199 [Solimonas aquatica]
MTLLSTRLTTLDGLGDQILDFRELPRPHVALQIGLHPVAPIIDRIRTTAEPAGMTVVAADLSGVDAEDVLWKIGTALFAVVDGEPPVRPTTDHPALAFKRLFNAVVGYSDDDFVLIVGPIDHLEAVPDKADNIYGALRAAVVEFERRVQLIVLVRADIIRKQVFWLDRPMMEFASFLDLRVTG